MIALPKYASMAVLALTLSTSYSFQAQPALSNARSYALRSRPTLQAEPPKWASAVDDFKERIESGKAAVTGAVVGSVCFAPFDFAIHFGNLAQVAAGLRACARDVSAALRIT